MVADSVDGKIDLIVTKSLSRFARNTVMLNPEIIKKDAALDFLRSATLHFGNPAHYPRTSDLGEFLTAHILTIPK